MSENLSALSNARASYKPKLPPSLRKGPLKVIVNHVPVSF
jgi:hypothetical protein